MQITAIEGTLPSGPEVAVSVPVVLLDRSPQVWIHASSALIHRQKGYVRMIEEGHISELPLVFDLGDSLTDMESGELRLVSAGVAMTGFSFLKDNMETLRPFLGSFVLADRQCWVFVRENLEKFSSLFAERALSKLLEESRVCPDSDSVLHTALVLEPLNPELNALRAFKSENPEKAAETLKRKFAKHDATLISRFDSFFEKLTGNDWRQR